MFITEEAEILKDKDLIDLGFGDFKNNTDQDMIDYVVAQATERGISYSSGSGDDCLKGIIKEFHNKKYKEQINSNNIQITVGALQGLYMVLNNLISTLQNEVIVIAPYFPPYLIAIQSLHGHVVIIDSNEDFSLPLVKIKKAINKSTLGIIINYPNNPSDYMYTDKERDKLLDILQENDLWLFEDRVYQEYRPNLSHPVWCDYKKKTVLLNSFSKSCAMTGWRLGYMIADEKIIKDSVITNEAVTFSPLTLSQYAGEYVLKNFERYSKKVVGMVQKNGRMVEKILESNSYIENSKYNGGMYIFIKINLSSSDFKKFYESLFLKYKVKVFRGNEFGKKYHNYLRITLSGESSEIKKGVNRMIECLNDFHDLGDKNEYIDKRV